MIVTSSISPSLKIGLQFLGVWPDMPYSIFYRLIYMSSILIIQYFQYIYLFAHLNRSEFSNIVDDLPITLDYSLTFVKLVALWVHRRVIHQMLDDMNCDWRECIIVDQRLHIMTIKARISHFCSKAMVSFYIITAIIYLFGKYAISFVHLTDEDNGTSRQFPIKIQFPFETDQSPIFEVLVVILLVHLTLNGYTVAILNALLLTLVFHVSGQIDIICQEFRTMSKKTPLYGSSASTLEMLVQRHNRVISFSGNMNKLFSFIALMQAVWNTIVICPLALAIIISLDNDTDVALLVKAIFAYAGIMMEIFIFCFAGEYLSFKSKSIAYAAYESLWYDMPLNQRRSISFIVMRSQRQLTITAGGITNLSLEAFASIMKASASYISVLYAMY